MYFGTFLKTYCAHCHEIFSIPRGYQCHQRVKILRESDEGIFMGGGKKIFRPPISPLRGVRGPPNFYIRWDP